MARTIQIDMPVRIDLISGGIDRHIEILISAIKSGIDNYMG